MSEVDRLFDQLRSSAFAQSDPNRTPQQGAIGDGNVQPAGFYSDHPYSSFVGQSNVLNNPEMTGFGSVTLVSGVVADVGPGWKAKYILNSGTDPTGKVYVSANQTRGTNNSLNTNEILPGTAVLAAAAAYDMDIYVYQATPYDFNGSPALAYLTAAVRFRNYDAITTPAHYTTTDWYVEIVRVSDGAVVATSPAFNAQDLDNQFATTLLSTSTGQTAAAFEATQWLWRVRVHIVSDGSGTGRLDSHQFAEPELNPNYTPDPLPFAPVIGRWYPDHYKGYADDGTTFPTLEIKNDILDFGPGTAISDIRITRDGTNTLRLASRNGAGPVILKHLGVRQAVPKAVQTVVAGTAIVADYEVVQINSTGNVTMTAAPTIANGVDGQMLTIINVDTADTITLQDQGTLASSNLRLTAATVALAPRQSVQLMYSTTVGDWVQTSNLVAVI